jgi:hypothetical protein
VVGERRLQRCRFDSREYPVYGPFSRLPDGPGAMWDTSDGSPPMGHSI